MATHGRPIYGTYDSGASASSTSSTESEIRVGSFVESFLGSLQRGGGSGSFSTRGISGSFNNGPSSPIIAPMVSNSGPDGDKVENGHSGTPTPGLSVRRTYGATLTWGPETEDRRYRYQRPSLVQEEEEENARVTTRLLGSSPKVVKHILSWPKELWSLVVHSAPLMIGFLLQYSLTFVSVLTVGHLGIDELAAVSLATMTANLTGYAVYNGFCDALYTLCGQSFDAERYTHLGLHLQRCVIILMLATIPISVIWASSAQLIGFIVPNQKLADLAGGYLEILILGAPGYALFEAGKKYLEAQGNHTAATAVLGMLAPLNAVMSYFLVWDTFFGIGRGFNGAPIAVVITNWLMPVFLALYVMLTHNKECWHPLTLRAFINWRPILTLALPRIMMMQVEFLTIELLTLFSSYFGTATLAAQSILVTLMSFLYQLPLAMAVYSCASIEQHVGRGELSAARLATFIAIALALGLAAINGILLLTVQDHIGKLFSGEAEVVTLVARTIPIFIVFQAADVLSNITGGILRGQGRERIIGMLQAPTHYVLALPINLFTSFELGWGLKGLWTGSTIALVVIAVVQTVAVVFGNWENIVKEAEERADAAGPDAIGADVEEVPAGRRASLR
ncbi:mate-domain-containing protein [Peziza echinospora]|nr:mate-domain-containing protein [Peziza echinospora]